VQTETKMACENTADACNANFTDTDTLANPEKFNALKPLLLFLQPAHTSGFVIEVTHTFRVTLRRA
jgi:hypothetical protein